MKSIHISFGDKKPEDRINQNIKEIPTQVVYFDKKIGYPIKLSKLLTEDQRRKAYTSIINFNKLV